MSHNLTSQQRAVLLFVVRYRNEHQTPPTRADISEHFGWSSANAAEDHLKALASKGFVRLQPGRARNIFVLREAEAA